MKYSMHLTDQKWVTSFKGYELIEIEQDVENTSWKFTTFQITQSYKTLILQSQKFQLIKTHQNNKSALTWHDTNQKIEDKKRGQYVWDKLYSRKKKIKLLLHLPSLFQVMLPHSKRSNNQQKKVGKGKPQV